jgi:UDP-N-acetylmuramoyl-tripeptide--D-alanyl-D-alanine ligase
MYYTLGEWENATGGRILSGVPGIFVGGENPGGLAFDTRKINSGEWFVALIGKEGRDGHEFLKAAVDAGIEGAIISDETRYHWLNDGGSLPALLVKDTTIAIADAARGILGKYSPKKIAITGTVGKTSVKEILASICSQKSPTLKNPHNWNTEIGVPMTIFDITPENKFAVIECASRGAGQIRHLTRIIKPDIAVITSIGPGHLSEFGSIDNVAKAKWEIVDGLMPGGKVIAPVDSPYTADYRKHLDLVSFGLKSNADVYPVDYGNGKYIYHTPHGEIEKSSMGVSIADFLNEACSIAVAVHLDLTPGEIKSGIESAPGISGRSEKIIRDSGVEVILDAYNSNPLSLRNALDSLGRVSAERKVAILGDMLELGDDEIEYHRTAGKQASEAGIGLLITIGNLSKHIAGEFSGEKIHFDTTEECAVSLPRIIRNGDYVLLKASRGFKLEKLLESEW